MPFYATFAYFGELMFFLGVTWRLFFLWRHYWAKKNRI